MKKLVWYAVAVGLVVCSGVSLHAAGVFINPGSAPVSVINSPTYRFVGYSSATTGANAGGLAKMNSICQDSYGKTSRMCTTAEYMRSPNTPISPQIEGWIQPEFVTVVYQPAGPLYVDFSGLIGNHRLDCLEWQSSSGSNDGVESLSLTGGIAIVTCDYNAIHVTCCEPR